MSDRTDWQRDRQTRRLPADSPWRIGEAPQGGRDLRRQIDRSQEAKRRLIDDLTRVQCPECGRRFDLTNEDDAAEWHYGHDCETG